MFYGMTSITVGVYARISDDRAGSGLGVARQEADCRTLAERRGWTVADVYIDNDLSAYRGRGRPAYARLLDDLAAGAIGGVIAWHPDRLHRSPVELETFIDTIEATGAAVATVQAGDLDLSSPSGRMNARIVGAVARHESEHKADRQARKHAELALAGKVGGGGTRPFGFEADRVTVRPDEAEVIRDVARRLAAGETIRGLCADLQARGVATVTGRPWAPFTLNRMLRSPRVAGLREHRGEVVADAVWPAIVDRATWEACRRILSDPARTQATAPRSYLLTGGTARCGLCSAPLVARPRDDKRRCYVCARGPGFTGCGKIRSLAEPLEELVLDAVAVALDGPGLAAALDRDRGPAANGTATELADVERRLDDLAEMFAAGEIGRREWITARGRIGQRRDALAARVAAQGRTSALAALDGPGDLAGRLAALGFDQRRAVVAAVVDRVVVGPAVRGRNRFDPDRVTIEWRA
jgi:DNA invertase Pin-like site-specific DNA recombinase